MKRVDLSITETVAMKTMRTRHSEMVAAAAAAVSVVVVVIIVFIAVKLE